VLEHLPERERLKGLAAVKFLWEKVLVPLALTMVDPVREAVDAVEPDVIVADQQAFAGGIVAVERGLPWAGSACGTAELIDPVTLMPKVAAWFDGQVQDLCDRLGLGGLPAAGFDPRYSPQLLLQYSTRELVGPITRDLPSLAFVGPSLPRWAEDTPFPFEWLEQWERTVLVTLGTLSGDIGGRFLRTVVEAVDGRREGVIIVATPDELASGATGEVALPPNVLVVPFVPQLTLVPRMAAVLTHAGHNTTVGTLAAGVPLVCAPIRDDQPIIADQVVRAGAGVRVNFTRAKARDVAAALDAVLDDPSYRQAAGRIAASFATAGGPARAADLVEALVGAPAPMSSLVPPRL
jgi:hypothetical protein